MGVKWTKQQQQVIDLRDRNILVSAAAGSGKTAVLVERIITMLTDEEHPVNVDELLIVTFTEAAAGEMKERIRGAIEKALEENPENEHLKRQATLIHNAQITTIHSFCLSVIRDHFHVIDIDPGFRTAEEGELKLLRHDVLDELLEEKYAQKEERFLRFSNAYGGRRNDKKLEEMIEKAYDYSRSYPDGEGWLDSCVDAYRVDCAEDLEKSDYGNKIVTWAKAYLEEAKLLNEQATQISLEIDGPAVYEEALKLDAQTIRELLSAKNYNELSGRIQNVEWSRFASCRDKTVSKEKIEAVKDLREQVKGIVSGLKKDYFYQKPEEMAADMQICLPYMEELVGLVKCFSQRFDAKKRQENVIDFSDMEQFALQILAKKTEEGFEPSEVAKEYQDQFREIMIDEYQDSNLIQETILTSISGVSKGKYNIFMVGDVKQSIYSFRLSRPELFMEKFDTYDFEKGPKQRIDLHKNFRSRKEVLDSVNYIFRQIMMRNLGEIDYDDKAALYVGAEYPENPGCETEVLVLNTELKKYDRSIKASKQEMEARMIASRIRRLIAEQKVLDKKTGKLRPARYSDIVILTRSVKGIADIFVQELNREGIPAFSGTKEGYFATQEIGVLLDYLRVLDNRKQDIPLAAVLMSAFCGLNEQEMAVIRSSEAFEIPFYQAVENYLENGENTVICEKLKHCYGKMNDFREIVPYTPIHELLRSILTQTGYGQFISAMPGGAQRAANVEMLITKAQAFQSSSYKGLFHFVRYIEQLQKFEVDYGEASLEDEQSDTVRVMTIHKSKGLEFPIVFVVGMGKRFNMQDVNGSMIIHPELGVGIDQIDLDRRTKIPTFLKKMIQQQTKLETLGEELRVLYVALTRAKEKLIMTGQLKDARNLVLQYENAAIENASKGSMTFSKLASAHKYLDWVLPVAAQPDAPISIKVWDYWDAAVLDKREEQAEQVAKDILEHWNLENVYDNELKEHLNEQFSYRYPYQQMQKWKMKFTVSELKKRTYLSEESSGENGEEMIEEAPIVPLLPKFLQEEEEVKGASRGSVYHKVLELLDFTQEYNTTSLKEAIRQMEQDKIITKEMTKCIRIKDIQNFLNSNIGKRMQKAAKSKLLKTEQPFVLGVDAGEIYREEIKDACQTSMEDMCQKEVEDVCQSDMKNEMILVQGIIDVYFEEDGEIVLLDYKTDKVRNGAELKERYHAQLEYYAKALEQLLGKKVKEKVIYSFFLGEKVDI